MHSLDKHFHNTFSKCKVLLQIVRLASAPQSFMSSNSDIRASYSAMLSPDVTLRKFYGILVGLEWENRPPWPLYSPQQQVGMEEAIN
jgi:hypothetical protein